MSGYKMTDQEIFDWGAAHLLVQGEKSMWRCGACAYRGDEGRRCAVGAFVEDEKYSERFEYEQASAREVIEALSFTPGAGQVRLLLDLQKIHDEEASVRDWPVALRRLAARKGLDPWILDLEAGES